MLQGIYPPIFKSTEPAFIDTIETKPINFTLSSVNTIDLVNGIEMLVVRQSDNKTLYKKIISFDGEGVPFFNEGTYSVNVKLDDGGWVAGTIYKILGRFCVREEGSYNYTEWSNVMITKAIAKPTVQILNVKKINDTTLESIESTLTPLFSGVCEIDKELQDKYKFDLYSEDGTTLIESSGWLLHTSGIDLHRFKTVLENDNKYKVTYKILTVNGYEGEAESYTFLAVQTYLGELENVTIKVESDSIYCLDNGCINIYCSAATALNGHYILIRSDETSNFRVYEDLQYYTFIDENLDNSLIYQDFTIESGKKYKYALLMLNAAKLRTTPKYEENNPYHWVDFEYSYLYRDGVLLRLAFNQTMNSFKHTVLRTKQDTLGGKYPHLVQNGQVNYAEFPINGLISLHMDNDRTFFKETPEGYYYKDELVISKDKLLLAGEQRDRDAATSFTIDTNLTADNVYCERIFREKVEEFLNEFDYKLYKSPTEGNIVVGLMNVLLLPDAKLGRMIYSFTATAYEVMENNLNNLKEFGILSSGELSSLKEGQTLTSFGQVIGFKDNTDLYELIKKQEEIPYSDNYNLLLVEVTSIYIQEYPSIDLNSQILALEKLDAETIDIKESAKIREQINDLKKLLEQLNETSLGIKIKINGNSIFIMPNRVYTLNQKVTTLELEEPYTPVLVNYTCKVKQVENKESSVVITSIDSSNIWGLLAGFFTTDDSYTNSQYKVYRSLDIYSLIEEEAKKQVQNLYENSNYDFLFDDITSLDIEADAGTSFTINDSTIYVGKLKEEKTYSSIADSIQTIVIDENNRYVLSPIRNLINSIKLNEPAFCIINFKCLTTLLVKGGLNLNV